MYVYIFSEVFLIIRTEPYMIKMLYCSARKFPVFLAYFNEI
jgi:hypothetical protein